MAKTDLERRREIQRHTLVGLEEDLDDLRDELAEAMVDYESRLQDASTTLPDWLALDSAQIRKQFQFEDDVLGKGRLGPRAVALGAARVEAFIHEWVGFEGELADVDFEEDASEFENACEGVREVLSRLEDLSRELALDADSTFGQWLDDIITELEDKRERDEAALRELVGSGDVERGNQAREEIAELFEDQRRQAAEIKKAWEGIESLVFEGVEFTVRGIGEMGELLDRAMEGLSGAHESLEPEIDEIPDTVVQIDDIPDTSVDMEDDDDADPPGIKVDGERHTEKLDIPSETSQFLRKPKRNKAQDENVHEVETVELERDPEPSEPEPEPDASEPSEDSDVQADSEPELDEHSEPEDDSSEPEDEEESDAEEVSDVEDEALDEESEPSEPESIDQDSTPEADESGELEEESDGEDGYVGSAHRIVSDWLPISGMEKLVVLGWPAAVLVAVTPLAIIRLAGSTNVIDPFAAVPWFFPWGYVVCIGWMFIGMVFRHWRPVFDGMSMQLVRWSEHREEAEIKVTDEAVRVDGVRWNWGSITSDQSRWESRPDGTFGWLVTLNPKGAAPVTLVAPERNFTLWDQSEMSIESVPDDVWQVTPVVLQKIRDRI